MRNLETCDGAESGLKRQKTAYAAATSHATTICRATDTDDELLVLSGDGEKGVYVDHEECLAKRGGGPLPEGATVAGG